MPETARTTGSSSNAGDVLGVHSRHRYGEKTKL